MMMQKVPFVAIVLAGLVCLSAGQKSFGFGLPNLGVFEIEKSDEACRRLSDRFWYEYVEQENHDNRVCPQWPKFRAAYTGTFFPAIAETTSFDDCVKTAASIYSGERVGDRDVAIQVCHRIFALVSKCACGTLACVTDEVNREIRPAEFLSCKAFPQKICRTFEGTANATCQAYLANPWAPPVHPGIQFDFSKIIQPCAMNQCRAA